MFAVWVANLDHEVEATRYGWLISYILEGACISDKMKQLWVACRLLLWVKCTIIQVIIILNFLSHIAKFNSNQNGSRKEKSEIHMTNCKAAEHSGQKHEVWSQSVWV